MKMRIVVIIVMLLGTLYPFQMALANDLFYVGDVVVHSIGIVAQVDSYATVYAYYELTNHGSEEEEVDLQFAQSAVPLLERGEELSNPVVFGPHDTRYLALTCNLDISGETTKMLSLDPTLLFNGKPHSERTEQVIMKVVFMEGISGLVWASQEPAEEGFEGNQKWYSWHGADIYPTTLSLKWSTLQVELSVEKEASPQEITAPDQVIDLEINVQNNGDTTVSSIGLVDQYVASHFEAVQPIEEFGDGGSNGTMLVWSKSIGSLAPGQSETLAYSVRYVGFGSESYEFDLKPCVVTVDGEPVSTSNEVRMSQIGSESEGAAVVTQDATEVSTDSATLNMNYNAGGLDQVEVCFAYKKTTDSDWSYTDWVSKSGDGPYSESVAGLDTDAEYEFKAQLRFNSTVRQGITNEFTTDGGAAGGGGGCGMATGVGGGYGIATTVDSGPIALVSVALLGVWANRRRRRGP